MTQAILSTVTSQKSPLATEAEGSATKEPISADALLAWAIEIPQSAFSMGDLMYSFHILAAPQWMELNFLTHLKISPVKRGEMILHQSWLIWKRHKSHFCG